MARLIKILYLGPLSGTCLDRANALRRLGYQVMHEDLRLMLPMTAWVDRVIWHFGGNLFSRFLMAPLNDKLKGQQFDLCWIDSGELVTPKVISLLRQHAKKIISYSIDDPFGPRDGMRFKAFRQSLPFYNLNVVVREENIPEAYALGAKDVMRVFRSADELSHSPRNLSENDHKKWDSEVLFLGTWFPERGSFLMELILLGVPLTIRGSGWHKSPEWSHLKGYWKGGSIHGDDYAKAIQCAKVNLGFVSKENRDLHTTRSSEIPALGGFFCAERTSEHINMYVEGEEAFFRDNPKECAAMCELALTYENRRQKMAKSGQKRLKDNGHLNEIILNEILERTGLML